MGGRTANPTYADGCSGEPGHADITQLTFDPKQVSFREILEVFFVIHDPTTLNRQGNDVGTQYRSAIFYHSPEQKAAAEQVIASMGAAKIYEDLIVTEVVPASKFYMAEDYHQEYFRRNPAQPYCAFVVRPKVAKFRKHFLEKLKKRPTHECLRFIPEHGAPDRPQPIRNALRALSSWERPSCYGVRGSACPGRDPNGRHSKCRFRIGAAGFAAAFPADFPPLRFSTAFPSGGLAGFLSDFSYLLLLFLRCFFGFSLLRHH